MDRSETARITIGESTHEFPIVMGTKGDRAISIARLRDSTGHTTLDEGCFNTGSCDSKITFIDGDKGILRYRGISIEQLARPSTFVETCWLLIYGDLPTQDQLKCWSGLFTKYEMIHEGLCRHFDGFPPAPVTLWASSLP